jgi:hypothetical protein
MLAGDMAGSSVGSVGDLDADGRNELLIGAPGHDFGWQDAGAVHLFTRLP